jgi:hypothetical protein
MSGSGADHWLRRKVLCSDTRRPGTRRLELMARPAERIPRLSPTYALEHCLPVTARLSKRLYEVLGEDVANEPVDWFNTVDLTHRADLRELNELYYAGSTPSWSSAWPSCARSC